MGTTWPEERHAQQLTGHRNSLALDGLKRWTVDAVPFDGGLSQELLHPAGILIEQANPCFPDSLSTNEIEAGVRKKKFLLIAHFRRFACPFSIVIHARPSLFTANRNQTQTTVEVKKHIDLIRPNNLKGQRSKNSGPGRRTVQEDEAPAKQASARSIFWTFPHTRACRDLAQPLFPPRKGQATNNG